jgi:hypothetical protein
MASHARRLNIIFTTMTTNKLIHFLVAATEVVVVVVMSGPADSQDRLKLEQDHCDQHLSCTSASLRLQNCRLVKKMN